MPELGRLLILIGALIALLGLILLFGLKLPGDILIKKDNVLLFFPIVTSLVVSLLLTLLFWLFRR